MLIAGAAIIGPAAGPRIVPLAQPLASLPTQLLGFPSQDLEIPASERRWSDVSDYLFRVYQVDSATRVSLYLGYYAADSRQSGLHSPRTCLPNAGWMPMASSIVSVPTGGRTVEVNRYLLKGRGRSILVYYWFQGRGRVTAREREAQIALFGDALLRHRAEESLVRIIVPLNGGSDTAPVGPGGLAPDSLAVSMIAQLIPQIERVLPSPPSTD